MKPLFGYLLLAISISFGIASNSFAKISEGFTKLTPSILCILFMCVTMFSMAKAMTALPVGFAYSTYSGLVVTGVVLFAVLKYNQIPNIYGITGIILIIIGVIMVNYLGIGVPPVSKITIFTLSYLYTAITASTVPSLNVTKAWWIPTSSFS